ncbi:hypothetical protein PtA15_8A98 [Puccinia triticina]|uniref:Uncharacterized protein n=1 Tax=Puccinia triticina TaxID=208348 RepID=A0ABY7CTA0_9BASI|nr:uncharacterized protein PtA15_8A98 [Puccinia triticina]WAQ87197.1 hypothetical protein PtA15_8A98 [Puccinia triticina]
MHLRKSPTRAKLALELLYVATAHINLSLAKNSAQLPPAYWPSHTQACPCQ